MKMLAGIKEFWGKLSQKTKILAAAIAGVVVLAGVAFAVWLWSNASDSGYEILYPGITQAETMQVYAALQSMEGVSPTLNSQGQLMVPKEQKDNLILQLAGKGYPQTTLAYDTFLSNTGFTMTEMEKKELLLFQLQDRLQDSIRTLSGVESAIVTITVPEDSNYVWETQQEVSTASVILGLQEGTALTPEQVTAIRNVVAYATPKLEPENVRVVDAGTGIDLEAESDVATSGVDFERLEYERQIEKQIVNKVKELLSSVYGPNVTAVATVRLNYDVTKSELRELIPGDDGNGMKTHRDEQYSLNGAVAAGDIVGEENNTDVPGYVNSSTSGSDTQTTNYQSSTDYEFGERIVQTENGQAYIEDASVSVLVQDENFTTEKQERLVEIISKGVLINRNSISVEYIDLGSGDSLPADTEPEPGSEGTSFWRSKLFWIIAGASLLLLLIIVLVIIILVRRNAKKKVLIAAKEAENLMRTAQEEIDEHKRMLAEAAQANSDPKDNAIADEVREFAKQNPEITATLIRSLLKEDA
ncbi:MAG: flagellar M-ring protein FliF [Provencibacterium sp.]|nr:flagellar M-ring protein FliF [Provencibacterium sp.]